MTSVLATTGVEAPWKQRFRVERILWSALAEERPDRGFAVSNRSGRYQLYAWEVPTGELRQLTDRPECPLWLPRLPRAARLLPGRHGRGRDRAPSASAIWRRRAGGHIAQSASLLDLWRRHQRNRKSARLLAGRPRGFT